MINLTLESWLKQDQNRKKEIVVDEFQCQMALEMNGWLWSTGWQKSQQLTESQISQVMKLSV